MTCLVRCNNCLLLNLNCQFEIIITFIVKQFIKMDTLRKSKSMINLNTGNFEKEQLLRLLTTNISNALKFSNLPDFNSGNVLLEMFGKK